MRPFLVLVLLLAPLAGCVGDESVESANIPVDAPDDEPAPATPTPTPPPGEPPAEPEPPQEYANETVEPEDEIDLPQPPTVEVHEFTGTLTFGLRNTVMSDSTAHAFTMRPGATRVVAVLHWNATGPTDLDAVLLAPGPCAESELQDPATGTDCSVNRNVLRQSDSRWFQNGAGSPAEPDSPSVLDLGPDVLATITECAEAECEWTAIAWSDTAVGAEYHYRVEVHYP